MSGKTSQLCFQITEYLSSKTAYKTILQLVNDITDT